MADGTGARAARHATIPGALDRGQLALIGTFGAPGGRRALVRHATGRVARVTVGDRLAGAVVARIEAGSVILRRGDTLSRLAMPGSG